MDGFSHYDTDNAGQKGWIQSFQGGTPYPPAYFQIMPSDGRRGNGCLRLLSDETAMYYAKIPVSSPIPITTIITGFAVKISEWSKDIFYLLSPNTVTEDVLGYLITDTFGNLRAYLSTGPELISTTTIIPVGVYTYIEFKYTVSPACPAGACQLRVNGVLVGSNTGGEETNLPATDALYPGVGYAMFIGGGTTGFNTDIADLYICDDQTTNNIDFLGDCRVDTLYPNADGSALDMVPSIGTDHFVLVNNPLPSTGTYVSGDTPGQMDLYGMDALPTITGTLAIHAVQAIASAKKSGVEPLDLKVVIDLTNMPDTPLPLDANPGMSLYVMDRDSIGANWDETSVNAIEVGAVLE